MDNINDLPLDEIVLFRPIYTEKGVYTELKFGDGTSRLYRRSLNALRGLLARKFAVDLSAQRYILSDKFGRQPPLPIYYPGMGPAGGRIFVPLKMCRPRVSRDRAYGYVALDHIKNLEAYRNYSRLCLKDGSLIELFSSPNASRMMIALGRDTAAFFSSSEPDEEELFVKAVRSLLGSLNRIERHLEQLAGKY